MSYVILIVTLFLIADFTVARINEINHLLENREIESPPKPASDDHAKAFLFNGLKVQPRIHRNKQENSLFHKEAIRENSMKNLTKFTKKNSYENPNEITKNLVKIINKFLDGRDEKAELSNSKCNEDWDCEENYDENFHDDDVNQSAYEECGCAAKERDSDKIYFYNEDKPEELMLEQEENDDENTYFGNCVFPAAEHQIGSDMSVRNTKDNIPNSDIEFILPKNLNVTIKSPEKKLTKREREMSIDSISGNKTKLNNTNMQKIGRKTANLNKEIKRVKKEVYKQIHLNFTGTKTNETKYEGFQENVQIFKNSSNVIAEENVRKFSVKSSSKRIKRNSKRSTVYENKVIYKDKLKNKESKIQPKKNVKSSTSSKSGYKREEHTLNPSIKYSEDINNKDSGIAAKTSNSSLSLTKKSNQKLGKRHRKIKIIAMKPIRRNLTNSEFNNTGLQRNIEKKIETGIVKKETSSQHPTRSYYNQTKTDNSKSKKKLSKRTNLLKRSKNVFLNAGSNTNATITAQPLKVNRVLVKSIYQPGFIDANAEICHNRGKNLKVLIAVTSAPRHTAARNFIRETWGKEVKNRKDIALVFVVGSLSPHNKIAKKMKKEHKTFGDIILGRFLDSYDNLTLKSVSILEFVHTFCPKAKFMLKIDEDVFLNVQRLLKLINQIKPLTRAIYGSVHVNPVPFREKSHRYYLPYDQFSRDRLPNFLAGPAYLIPVKLVGQIYRTALIHHFVRLEDVFVTGILAEHLIIRRKHIPWFLTLDIRNCLPECENSVGILIKKPREHYELLEYFRFANIASLYIRILQKKFLHIN